MNLRARKQKESATPRPRRKFGAAALGPAADVRVLGGGGVLFRVGSLGF